MWEIEALGRNPPKLETDPLPVDESYDHVVRDKKEFERMRGDIADSRPGGPPHKQLLHAQSHSPLCLQPPYRKHYR